MSTLRELKTRIGSVASTQKTTSAMKMISSSKMRKATGQLQRLSPYRHMVQHVISHLLVTDQQFDSPLIAERDVQRVALVVFGSDDGLCGGFNVSIFKQLLGTIKQVRDEYGAQVGITIVPVGKKMAKAVSKIAGKDIQVETVALNTRSGSEELYAFTDLMKTRFLERTFDRVEMLYMHFISTGKQVFTREQLLPVSYQGLADNVDPRAANSPCLFEPDANTIFNAVLPLHIKSMLQDVFIQSTASEQSARVMAMQAASDNAKELLDELQLEYNKLRQQGITTELLDILGGQVER
ncbi:MAG: ATP synthase F1 subunit gamma [Muribaculaceae bacterium]|nr:ATP synthase F1 subunit gamma [Muribaculaceae bacterium]